MPLTPLQIEERRLCLGGSDAPAIVAGGDEWRKLWAVKTQNAEEEDLSDILAVQLGSFTEPFNLDWYERRTGRNVTRRGERALHPTIPYLAANLDGVTTTAAGFPAYIDAKHVGKAGDQITLRYTAQCTHCAIVLGFDWWCLSTLIGNSRWELTEQEVDPFFAAEYLEKCREFWHYVWLDQPPPEIPPLPAPPPRKLHIVQLEDDFEQWPNWGPDFAEEMDTWARTKPAADRHGLAHRIIKEMLPEGVGTVIRGRVKVTRDRADAVRISMSKGTEE